MGHRPSPHGARIGGGGIVADPDADAEYEETLAKGAALQRALIRAGCD